MDLGVRGVGEVPIVPPLAAVANAIAEMKANSRSPNERARSGAAMLLSAGLSTPDAMAPKPMNRVRT